MDGRSVLGEAGMPRVKKEVMPVMLKLLHHAHHNHA